MEKQPSVIELVTLTLLSSLIARLRDKEILSPDDFTSIFNNAYKTLAQKTDDRVQAKKEALHALEELFTTLSDAEENLRNLQDPD